MRAKDAMRYVVCGSKIGIESKSLQTGNGTGLKPGHYNGDGRRSDLSVIWGTNGERRSYHLLSVRVC